MNIYRVDESNAPDIQCSKKPG
ncbi:hypothetical protein [Candidatus Williamhamiltonella defendens]